MGISEIVTLLVAISGLLTGVFAYRKSIAEAGKLEQEITDIVLQRAKIQLDAMRSSITDLEDENKKLHECIENLEDENRKLRTKLNNASTAHRKRIRELEAENTNLIARIDKLEKGDTGPLNT